MGIEFEDQQYTNTSKIDLQRPGGITGWLMKNNLAKDKRQASLILIGFVVVMMLLLIVIQTISGPAVPTEPPANTYDPQVYP